MTRTEAKGRDIKVAASSIFSLPWSFGVGPSLAPRYKDQPERKGRGEALSHGNRVRRINIIVETHGLGSEIAHKHQGALPTGGREGERVTRGDTSEGHSQADEQPN